MSSDSAVKKITSFYMPGEERFFFDYFHQIALGFIVLFSLLGLSLAKMTILEAVSQAVLMVLPLYAVYFLFAKRFADEVTLDFDRQEIRFTFKDGRGTVTKAFREVEKVNFQFYLTFVLEDGKVMVKRPANKKEVFQVLSSVFKVDRGIFPIT
jgi:hypothetical protein